MNTLFGILIVIVIIIIFTHSGDNSEKEIYDTYMGGFWRASDETLYRCDYTEAHLYVSDGCEHKTYIVAMDNYINTPCTVSLIGRATRGNHTLWTAKLDIPDEDQIQSQLISIQFDFRRSKMTWFGSDGEPIFEWIKDADVSNAIL